MALLTVIAAVLGAGALLQNLLQSYPPYISGIARKTYKEMPNVLPPVADLVEARYKNVISSSNYGQATSELGLSGEWSETIYDSAARLLDGRDYVTAWRRKHITDVELQVQLEMLHYSPDDIERIKLVTEFYPSPIDLVRFAVREVYKTEQVVKYGMDKDADPEYFAAAEKAGLPEDRAMDFWKAHWMLPSVQQAFEMMHRGEITQAELLDLLRALDVMPYWRDKLTAIAYHPYTRVDVRRMHKLGVLSEDELLEAYMDLGFDKEKAGNMVRFTLEYNSDDTTGITRAAVTKAYKEGIVSEADLSAFLTDIGYTEAVVTFWVRMADHEIAQEEIAERKADLSLRYRLGAITKQQFATALGVGGVSSGYVETAVKALDRQEAQKLKMPTKADLSDWLEMGIIDADIYTGQMIALGYRQQDVIRYLTEIALSQPVDEIKYLATGTYIKWLKKGIVTEAQFRIMAEAKDIREIDVDRMITEALEVPREAT